MNAPNALYARSIIVGTDFSECSAGALVQAMRIAADTGARLRVVHVIDSIVVARIEEALGAAHGGMREQLIADAKEAWTVFAARVPDATALPIDVVVDNRIAGILRLARTHHADLLVMGAFGQRAPDVGVGTVATACVRKSTADVLLVREGKLGPYQRIVAATDFSEISARALARAARLAHQDGAEFHVLHVFEAPWNELHYRAPTPLTERHLQQQYRDALSRRLEDFTRRACADHPALRVQTLCRDGTAHRSMIVEYARECGADLVVLGTRGRSNLRDILLGSTAERVLEQSVCSVLAVKPEGFSHPLSEPPPPESEPLRSVF